MKTKIESLLPREKHSITIVDHNIIHICDRKDANPKRGIEVTEACPQDINPVFIANNNRISVVIDAFKDNALPIQHGNCSKQCECILFPEEGDNIWILMIETKYASDSAHAFKKEFDYPNCMVTQILATVNYFRNLKIIGYQQKVHALVAFPNVESDYHDRLKAVLEEAPNAPKIDAIKADYNVIIRGSNYANIISNKRIRLIQSESI